MGRQKKNVSTRGVKNTPHNTGENVPISFSHKLRQSGWVAVALAIVGLLITICYQAGALKQHLELRDEDIKDMKDDISAVKSQIQTLENTLPDRDEVTKIVSDKTKPLATKDDLELLKNELRAKPRILVPKNPGNKFSSNSHPSSGQITNTANSKSEMQTTTKQLFALNPNVSVDPAL